MMSREASTLSDNSEFLEHDMRFPGYPILRFPSASSRAGLTKGLASTLGMASILLTAAIVQAQQAAPAAPGGSQVVTLTRPLWTETLLTLIMVGVALFAVCRSSNRT